MDFRVFRSTAQSFENLFQSNRLKLNSQGYSWYIHPSYDIDIGSCILFLNISLYSTLYNQSLVTCRTWIISYRIWYSSKRVGCHVNIPTIKNRTSTQIDASASTSWKIFSICDAFPSRKSQAISGFHPRGTVSSNSYTINYATDLFNIYFLSSEAQCYPHGVFTFFRAAVLWNK